MSWHEQLRQQAMHLLSGMSGDVKARLNEGLRLLAKWRSVMIQNTVVQHQGTRVWQGPLQGLEFLPRSTEGCHVAKLLGCYEQPLQPFIEAAITNHYPVVLNIGCAEGYYAVGMARRMLDTRVLAFDCNEQARQVCATLAKSNGVDERVEVGAHFIAADFSCYAGQRVLVLCDIEGGEEELLRPELAPALRGFDLIVEVHDCLRPGLTSLLSKRFAASHDIIVVQDNGQRSISPVPPWFMDLAHLDQLLAVWEWRSGPTPWLVMHAKSERP